MNKGFKLSTGDIIVYLNADDYFLPGAFSSVIPYFEKGADFVVGKIRVTRHDGSYWINDAKVGHEEMLRHWEPQAFCVNPVGYFYRREVQEMVNGFNIENHYYMDLEFLLECSKKYSFTKMDNDQILGVFRNIRNTKTEKAKSGIKHYWSEENFNFINRFLSEMPEKDSLKFKKEREKGYKMRNITEKLEQSGASPLVSFWLKVKLFFLSEKKVFLVFNFLAGR
jgi:glycosyltransferase involved in cell wall biosynthesis